MGLQFATIISVIAVITGTQGVFLLCLWLMDRRVESLAWWAGSFGLLTMGAGLAVWKSFEGPVLAGVAGGALVILAFGLVWQAARVFDGRTLVGPVLFGIPVAWFAVNLVAAEQIEPHLAVVSASLSASVFLLLALRELLRGRRETLTSRRPLVLSLVAIVASILLQVLFDLGPGMRAHAGGSLPYGVWLMLGGAIAVSTAAAMALGMERERQQRNRDVLSSLDPQTGALGLGAFLGQAARLVAGQLKSQSPVTFVLVELDCEAGSEDYIADAVHAVNDSFMALSRSTDIVARVRAGTFAVIMPAMEPDEALPHFRRVLRESKDIYGSGSGWNGTGYSARVSLASSSEVGHDLRALMLAAEGAMDEVRYTSADAFVVYSAQHQNWRRDVSGWAGGVILGPMQGTRDMQAQPAGGLFDQGK